MDRPWLAKEVNRHILELAERFEARVAPDADVVFLCECGWLGEVTTTLAEYREHGALLAGHPTAASQSTALA